MHIDIAQRFDVNIETEADGNPYVLPACQIICCLSRLKLRVSTTYVCSRFIKCMTFVPDMPRAQRSLIESVCFVIATIYSHQCILSTLGKKAENVRDDR